MFKSIIKGFFGNSEKEPSIVRSSGPLGLGLSHSVTIDLVHLKLEQAKFAMPLPSGKMHITGHGIVRLSEQSQMHRFYDDNNVMLQVLCENGIDDTCVREVMLYHPWDSVVPETLTEWLTWDSPTGKIGAARFSADGFTFERLWGEPQTPYVSLAEFVEDVTVDDGSTKAIHQKVMPYKREVGVLRENLLLAVERDLALRDRGSVTFMIGYGLTPADLTVI